MLELFFELPLTPRLAGARELYYRENDFVVSNGALESVRGEAKISFDTFFGAVSLEKLRRYTTICRLHYRFEVNGSFNILLCTEDGTAVSGYLEQTGEIGICLSDIPGNSKLLYPVLQAKKTGGRISRIQVFAEGEGFRPVNCALIFCTFRREKSVVKNVDYLYDTLGSQCRIIVSDNGGTLKEDSFREGVTLVGGENVGGSGGFGRGMDAACKIKDITHLLLMDDDVEIDSSAVQRALNFVKFLRPEERDLSLAGSMLYLDKPTRQFAAGGYFSQDGIQRDYGHFLDLSNPADLLKNQDIFEINYGGWWCMLMPAEYAKKGERPMPFFLKYDDVEYALRCRQRILTMNGVGVWHEKFESKYNSAAEYYNIRNYLYLCSLYVKGFTGQKARYIARQRLLRKLFCQQYQMAEAVLWGYQDYKKGMNYLKKTDPAKRNMEVITLNYTLTSYEEIVEKWGIQPAKGRFYPPPAGKRGYLRALMPKRIVLTDKFYDHPVQYLTARYAVHCDHDKNQGYVTKGRFRRFLWILTEFYKS